MLQQWLLLTVVAAGPPCPVVNHVPAADVVHVPAADVDAGLVGSQKPMPLPPFIERSIGDDGVIVDIDIASGVQDAPSEQCE